MPRLNSAAGLAALAVIWLATLVANAQQQKAVTKEPPGFKEQLTVPEGTIDEQLAFFQRLKQQRPNLETEAQVRAHFQRAFETIAAGTSKLLAQKLTDEQELQAITAHLEALAILNRLEDPRAKAPLLAMAEKVKSHKDRTLADFARVQLLQLQLTAAMNGEPGAGDKVVEELKAYLSEGKPGGDRFDTGRQVARALEMAGQYDAALAAYDLMHATFLKTANLELTAAAHETAKAARARLGVIGKKIELEGTTVTGKPFDIASLAGKVVLVDFWATWCGPCVRELPNVKQNYEKYHSHGFEVVGISLDEDRSALEGFLKEHELPWTTLFSDNTQTTQALANRFGVEGIPALLLVGKDGKVITLRARGADLGKELERLLGPVEEKPAPEKK